MPLDLDSDLRFVFVCLFFFQGGRRLTPSEPRGCESEDRVDGEGDGEGEGEVGDEWELEWPD